jgi:anti-sigma factor RsiW
VKDRIPLAGASDIPTLGNTGFAVTLVAARPQSPVILGLATTRAIVRMGSGCGLSIGSGVIALGATSSSSGSAAFRASIPNAASVLSTQVYAQFTVGDPAGRFLNAISLSQALQLIIGASIRTEVRAGSSH